MIGGMRVGREVRRRSSRPARPWRRSRRRCRAAPRRARPASAPRARSRPSPFRFSTDVHDAELLQRGLGVAADRHRLHVAGGDAAVAGELGEIEALVRCLTLPILESFGAISTSRLPSRLTRVLVLDELVLRAVVHPFEVGGDEDVGRRALLDLLASARRSRHSSRPP